MLAFINNVSPVEWALVALILVVFFGGKVVSRLARISGETLREVKKAGKSFTEAIEDDKPEKEQKGDSK